MDKFVPKYSGKKSQRFWDKVNEIDDKDHLIFQCCLVLQNVENSLIELLNDQSYKQNQNKRK